MGGINAMRSVDEDEPVVRRNRCSSLPSTISGKTRETLKRRNQSGREGEPTTFSCIFLWEASVDTMNSRKFGWER